MSVQLFITAFSEFGGVDINPTMVLLEEISQNIIVNPLITIPRITHPHLCTLSNPLYYFPEENYSKTSTKRIDGVENQESKESHDTNSDVCLCGLKHSVLEIGPSTSIHKEVVEVSIQGVQSYYRKILPDILSKISSYSDSPPSAVYFLHLGLSGRANKICIEQWCYNMSDFVIPDQLGFQPRREPIVGVESNGVSTTHDLDLRLLIRECIADHERLTHNDNSLLRQTLLNETDWTAYLPHLDVDHPLRCFVNLNSLLKSDTLSFNQAVSINEINDESVEAKETCIEATPVSCLFETTSDYIITDTMEVTNDPGSFVCNYFYFCSLYLSNVLTLYQQELNVPHTLFSTALFIHIPYLSVIDLSTQQHSTNLAIIKYLEHAFDTIQIKNPIVDTLTNEKVVNVLSNSDHNSLDSFRLWSNYIIRNSDNSNFNKKCDKCDLFGEVCQPRKKEVVGSIAG